MRRRPGTIAILLLGFVLAWHACAVGFSDARIENVWVGMLWRVASSAQTRNSPSHLAPHRHRRPFGFPSTSSQDFRADNSSPTSSLENVLIQQNSGSTLPHPLALDSHPNGRAGEAVKKYADDHQSELPNLEPFVRQPPIRIVAFADSRFRPNQNTWRRLIAVHPLPVDRVRPATPPSAYHPASLIPLLDEWSHDSAFNNSSQKLPAERTRHQVFAKWFAPIIDSDLGSPTISSSPPISSVHLQMPTYYNWLAMITGWRGSVETWLRSLKPNKQPDKIDTEPQGSR